MTGSFREPPSTPGATLEPSGVLLRKPLYCNAKFEKRTWMTREEFLAEGLGELSKYE